ncbi:MAG: ABC transporter permease, partial [Gemmatimonadota bacterium]
MTFERMAGILGRLVEGVAIALDSIRGNKVRASLTILGVGIGVMVVIGMASMITGINRSVMSELETLGPSTFFVERYLQGGINISDGSDEMSPWRKNPWLQVSEAELLRQLPLVREVTWREGTGGPVSYQDEKLASTQVIGFSPTWVRVVGGTITAGRSFTQAEYAAGALVVVINDKMANSLFPGLDPIGKRIKVFGQPFDVIGLYVDPNSMFGSSSPMAVIPHSTFTKVADYFKGWMSIAVTPVEGTTGLEAQDQVIAAMRTSRGLKPAQDNDFAVVSQDRMMEMFGNVT